jgi:hypothetical protein
MAAREVEFDATEAEAVRANTAPSGVTTKLLFEAMS